MPTYLSEIVAAHRRDARADRRDLDGLCARALESPKTEGFADAIRSRARGQRPELCVIAEVKRRSPSRGELAPNLDPAEVAAQYAAGGAACLSVLTDEAHFGGCAKDVAAAKRSAALPVLRKDFTVSAADVCDARLMGADAVLLIAAVLDDAEMKELADLADQLELDSLVEVHDEAELERALALGATLIGVNQRDLATFEVDSTRAARLASAIPEDVVAVAESGIRGPDDVRRLAGAGYDAALVGETVVTATDRAGAVRALVGNLVAPRREPAG